MPPKTVGTKHEKREQWIRTRLKSAIRLLELPDPNPLHLTVWGVFERRCRDVANAKNLKWYKDAANGQGPKGSTSLRRFAEGKQGAYQWVMNVVELVCIDIEMEHKLAAQTARHAGEAQVTHMHLPHGPEEAPHERSPLKVVPDPEPEPALSAAVSTAIAEFDAAKAIVQQLEGFPDKTAYRILRYATMFLDERVND